MKLKFKSPFMVNQQFISPLLCEELVDDLDLSFPDENSEGIPQKTIIQNDRLEEVIYDHLVSIVPQIEEYYGVTKRGITTMDFEWYTQGCEQSEPISENSRLMDVGGKRKWARVRDRDISFILFLTEYCDKPNFDTDYEVYGGKLEFPTWGFGFNPQRGTLIAYPSAPNFCNVTSSVQLGDLVQVRFHMATQRPFSFKPQDYPGNYKVWFQNIV